MACVRKSLSAVMRTPQLCPELSFVSFVPFCGQNLLLELLWREAVDEGFEAVDGDDGDVVLIFCEQFIVRFDVDLFECELIAAAGLPDRGFRFVAEVAAGARIDDHVGLHSYLLAS